MNRYKNYIVEIITIIILILIDLWTKTLAVSKLIESDVVLIPGVLEFHYLENNDGITIEEYLQHDQDKS